VTSRIVVMPNRDQKMKATPPQTIDEYIAAFPPNVQDILQKIRTIIAQAAPDAEETIKYQIPTFVWHGNLVHFAAFQHHIGFYPTPSAIEAFSRELARYKNAKGSVQFPLDQPVPYGLIQKMVEFRVKETREKIAVRKRKK
jgi:uncharacterized protein YdhG (YjbR/CyaY superfamily)